VADLEKLQRFADQHDFGLTAPLSHAQVRQLAEYWLPQMRFYWDERFHPVTLDDMFDMVEGPFAALPPAAQEAWRVGVQVREGSTPVMRPFDPPVVHVPDGIATTPAPQSLVVPVRRVLNEGSPGRPALRLPEVDKDTVVTHGASFGRANQFFGPLRTLAGNNTAVAGDPFLPRADEPDPDDPDERRPQITVMASFLNLFELLKYELIVAEADAEPGFDYPPDGLRGGFAIVGSLIRRVIQNAPDFPAGEQRKFLLAAIAAHEAGGQVPEPPPGWRLDRVAWNAVTRYAFLEYHFFYAYNDFERYQTALFDNEHEGDDEGCCLVFDRGVLNVAASGGPQALLTAVPHSIITSVHEEFQDADLFRFIAPPILQPGQPAPPARDVVDFTIYVAGGSHATYLDNGDNGRHDLVDFQDTWSYIDENAPWLYLFAPLVLPISIILAIIEHFVDTEDFTSDDGLHGGPDAVVGEDPARVASHVMVLPMSADNHIYEPRHEDLLALRAFAGKWGGHDGIVDKSPPFAPKTGRYFRKLIDNQ
jgi:hypothetical protein